MRNLLIGVVVIFMVGPAFAQKLAVKIIDRQDNDTDYTYVVPGSSDSNSSTNVNCFGSTNTVDCNSSTRTAGSSTPAQQVSYHVSGATFSLQLPDGRVAVVNCESKFAEHMAGPAGNHRSCRVPLVDDIHAEFDGDKAKLEWPVSIDGKKMASETYKVLGVLMITKDAREFPPVEVKTDVTNDNEQKTNPLPTQEAGSSIEAPEPDTAGTNSGFPARWKSLVTGSIRTLRFEGEYIYSENVLPEASVKAGGFSLMDVKKDGDKYVGKTNTHEVKGGQSCSTTSPIELTLVTPGRIEGRSFAPPVDAKIDWNTCTYSMPADWQAFTWIPVR